MHGHTHNDAFLSNHAHREWTIDRAARFFGLHEARVTSIDDPDKQGRIRVRFHWLEEDNAPVMESGWCHRVVPFAGPTALAKRGRRFGMNWPMPEVGSLVTVGFNGGNPHECFYIGQPEYQFNEFGAPPTSKDSKIDWSLRIALQNGFEFGVDTEGNAYLHVPGNLRVKILCSAFVSARGVFTLLASKTRAVALSVLRLLAATIDQTNYPRSDEAPELRSMTIDAMSASQGRKDPGIGQVPDETDGE